jgi:hypothetical protein
MSNAASRPRVTGALFAPRSFLRTSDASSTPASNFGPRTAPRARILVGRKDAIQLAITFEDNDRIECDISISGVAVNGLPFEQVA